MIEIVKVDLDYIKCQGLESEIEDFWLKLKNEVIQDVEDETLIEFELKRQFVGAVLGENAGIIISIGLSLPQATLATILLWEKVRDYLDKNRKENQIVRVKSIGNLENICRLKLLSENVAEFTLVETNDQIEENDDLLKRKAAIFKFEDKNHYYIFVVDNDGEIRSFVKKTKQN